MKIEWSKIEGVTVGSQLLKVVFTVFGFSGLFGSTDLIEQRKYDFRGFCELFKVRNSSGSIIRAVLAIKKQHYFFSEFFW